MWFATVVTPIVSGRKYMPLPVAGTCNHIKMSRFCCPLRLSQFHWGGDQDDGQIAGWQSCGKHQSAAWCRADMRQTTILLLRSCRQIYYLCSTNDNYSYWCEAKTAAWVSRRYPFLETSSPAFPSCLILPSWLILFWCFSSRRERRLITACQAKPARPKFQLGGGGLGEAQVDVPLSVSHTCLWSITETVTLTGEYAYANDFEVRRRAWTDLAKD